VPMASEVERCSLCGRTFFSGYVHAVVRNESTRSSDWSITTNLISLLFGYSASSRLYKLNTPSTTTSRRTTVTERPSGTGGERPEELERREEAG
jgi:hypothetical protein